MSSAVANNMTSATGDESITGAAGNITRAIITMEAKEGKKQEILSSLIPLAELARKRQGILLLFSSPKETRKRDRPGIHVSPGNTTLSLMIRGSLEAHSCMYLSKSWLFPS